jgi:REP element-mobilizing transposase RayT
MTGSNKLPSKCRECAKSQVSNIHQKCHFCSELEFKESVLCDLNQCIQDEADFRCHAFQPILKLVNNSENGTTEQHDAIPKGHKGKSDLRLFDSDKIKYERALAVQKLSRDPDGVYIQLKYHLAWNVKHRMPIFSPTNRFIDHVHGIFLQCSELAGGFVALLYLAPDHIHLYVESDGELSIDEIVQKIKRFSNNSIVEKFPSVRDKLGGETEVWDEAYFVETVS